MDRIYDQANDKNVSAVVFYANTNLDDHKLYIDDQFSNAATYEDVIDAFNKRLLISMNNNLYIPVSMLNTFIIETSEWHTVITIIVENSSNQIEQYTFSVTK